MAATTKNALRGALKFVDEALADKTIPQSMRDALGHMRTSLKASWADIAKGAKPAKTDESLRDAKSSASLREQATIATAVEARMDDAANDYFNMLYGWGNITRDEWMCLNDCFDPARDSFMAKLLTDCPTLFARTMADEMPEDDMGDEGAGEMPVGTEMSASAVIELTSDVVPLTEASGATIPIKIIQAGWGSSGFYPKEVLQRDGPKVFPAGTHMYMNHPTAQEEAARPERSLNDLAAVTTSDAAWQEGPDGPGLYADCKPFSDSATRIKEMAKHIGVSIRASGQAENGEMDGRKGPIIKAINAGKSIDFVTQAGAGGKVLAESARDNPVAAVTESMEVSMTEQEKAEMAAIKAENARLKERDLLREAKDIVTSALPANLPALTRTRLIESLAKNPPIKDGAIDQVAFKEVITQTVKDEIAYLAQATGSGRITGMGGERTEPDPAKMHEALKATFMAIGMSESSASIAAKGRNN